MKGLPYVQDSSSSEHNQEFLETLLEIQEKIELCQTNDELNLIKNEILQVIKSDLSEVDKLFQTERINEILDILKKVKFYSNILDQINNKI
jgi:hypothetical protein